MQQLLAVFYNEYPTLDGIDIYSYTGKFMLLNSLSISCSLLEWLAYGQINLLGN